MLNKPSRKQQKIINKVKDNKNVIVNTVAGSGKTTTILSLAKQLPNKRILLLTYNNKLKNETKSKRDENNIKNVHIQTFHGFASKIISSTIKNDFDLENFINLFDFNKFSNNYDIICLDEMQDCTSLIFKMIRHCFYNVRKRISWIVVGDVRQCIYQYNGADSRYLTLFDKLMNIKMMKINILKNYRCAPSICKFWNKYCRLTSDRKLKPSLKSKYKLTYLILFNSYECSIIIDLILELKQKYNYNDDDFFILSYSIKQSIDNKTKKPIHRLFEECKNHNLNVFCPSNDETGLNDEEIKNKIVFSTFHQSKGRERKVVFVIGFDNTLYKYFKPNSNPDVCTNEIYVAITRARNHLILVEGNNLQDDFNYTFNFINKSRLKKDKRINLIEEKKQAKFDKFKSDKNEDRKFEYFVTNLVKNLSNSTIKEIKPLFNKIISKDTNYIPFKIKIQSYYKNKELDIIENITNLNSNAIITKIILDKFNIRTQFIDKKFINNIFIEDFKYKEIYLELHDKTKKWDEFESILFHVNFVSSVLDKRVYLLRQIDQYKWLNDFNDDYQLMKKSFLSLIDNKFDIKLEQEIEFDIDSKDDCVKNKCIDWLKKNIDCNFKKFKIIGKIDLINNKTMFEFKCVDEILDEHILQAITYIWMNNITKKYDLNEFILFNMKDNTKLIIKNDIDTINQIIKIIINSKIDNNLLTLSDEEFIKINKN